ncbi:carbohydrate ABC transporter permease [Roseicella aquatilis]|uniref:Sugar ABC transporter permease n=1 Tax=Roseicella aquatilis TaxID=2527868 RepID=A0A4V2WLW3_9PROT|nr:sugar ABC transporter permease [Roseicella aquatilis]TCZ64975.1 sugar ABC transporter permease [Roseicella aquatilis]
MSEISGAAPRPFGDLSAAPAPRGLRHAPLDRFFLPFAVGPTFLVMLAIFGLPLLFSLWLSLTGWSPQQGLFGGAYVGLANFEDLLSDRVFMGSLGVTCGFTAAAVSAQLLLGLGIALLLNLDLPGMRIFRTALVLPMMVTPIVGALCWKLLLDPHHGVVNHWLGTRIVWLGVPETALIAVWLVNVWHSTPYVALILLAGLRSLPHEPHEAAGIDGASRWQVFRHVTFPLLQPFLLVALLLRTIFEFRAFDNVYAMTGGGPANATMLLSMFTYLTSFVRFDFGLGAAAAWLMLLMSMVMCLLFIALLRRRGPR